MLPKKTLKPGQKATLGRGLRMPGRLAPGSRSARSGAGTPWRVAPRIGRRERDLQQRVKSAGGRWDPLRRVWMLRRDVAERLDLLPRVVGGGGRIWGPRGTMCLDMGTRCLDIGTGA